MDLSSFRISILPGSGVVARLSNAILVVPSFNAKQRPAVAELLNVCRNAESGAAVARRLGEVVLAHETGELPGFGVITSIEAGVNVVMHGQTEMQATGAVSSIQLSGVDSATWTDRILGEQFSSISVTAPGGTTLPTFDLTDLVEGIVPGGGAVLTARVELPVDAIRAAPSAPARPRHPSSSSPRRARPLSREADGPKAAPTPSVPPPPEPVASGLASQLQPVADVPAPAPIRAAGEEEPDAEFERTAILPGASALPPAEARARKPPRPDSAPVVEQVAQAPKAPRAAEPPSPPQPVPEEPKVPQKAQVTVKGVICPGPGRHFNHPDALICWRDGRNMVHQTRLLVDGPRPSLGRLVSDDGTAYEVVQDLILGREAAQAEAVIAGDAVAITPEDDQISRLHAAIRLKDWALNVSDLGSRNGTFVTVPGAREVRLRKDQVLVMPTESTVRVGNRSFTYHSYHRTK